MTYIEVQFHKQLEVTLHERFVTTRDDPEDPQPETACFLRIEGDQAFIGELKAAIQNAEHQD